MNCPRAFYGSLILSTSQPDSFDSTIIVVHPKERRSKCTVEPLRGRGDFVFWKYPHRGAESLDNYIQLGIDGPELSEADCDRGLLVLDGTWRYAGQMLEQYKDVPVRSLSGWKTAYPRNSKVFDDPSGGLATIEAIYIAYEILKRDTTGLLDSYHWRDEFLAANFESR